MSYQFLAHTADLKIKARHQTLKGLFLDMAEGMMEFLKRDFKVLKVKGDCSWRIIQIKSPDKVLLLVDFLRELLYAISNYREIYPQIQILKLEDNFLKAKLQVVPCVKFDAEIKGVTLHNVYLKQEKGIWEAVVLFDI